MKGNVLAFRNPKDKTSCIVLKRLKTGEIKNCKKYIWEKFVGNSGLIYFKYNRLGNN